MKEIGFLQSTGDPCVYIAALALHWEKWQWLACMLTILWCRSNVIFAEGLP